MGVADVNGPAAGRGWPGAPATAVLQYHYSYLGRAPNLRARLSRTARRVCAGRRPD